MYDLLCLENKEAREVKKLVSMRAQIMLVRTKDCFIFITLEHWKWSYRRLVSFETRFLIDDVASLS